MNERIETTVVDPNPHRPVVPSQDRLLYAELSHAIVGAAIEVHRHLGPGQLEAVYERALARELETRGVRFRRQVPIEVDYKGERVGECFADLIVEDKILVELKAVIGFHSVHVAQVLGYLRATRLRLGLLVNFNVPVLCRSVRRLIR
jgi:GxxExxY protein